MNRAIGVGLAFLAALLFLAALATGAAAEAKVYPWCVFYDPSTYNCGFMSYQQCMETARGNGGICRPNPFEAPRPQQQRRPKPN